MALSVLALLSVTARPDENHGDLAHTALLPCCLAALLPCCLVRQPLTKATPEHQRYRRSGRHSNRGVHAAPPCCGASPSEDMREERRMAFGATSGTQVLKAAPQLRIEVTEQCREITTAKAPSDSAPILRCPLRHYETAELRRGSNPARSFPGCGRLPRPARPTSAAWSSAAACSGTPPKRSSQAARPGRTRSANRQS